jgi:hypothetical protein
MIIAADIIPPPNRHDRIRGFGYYDETGKYCPLAWREGMTALQEFIPVVAAKSVVEIVLVLARPNGSRYTLTVAEHHEWLKALRKEGTK